MIADPLSLQEPRVGTAKPPAPGSRTPPTALVRQTATLPSEAEPQRTGKTTGGKSEAAADNAAGPITGRPRRLKRYADKMCGI